MKSLYESILDDEEDLMRDTGEAAINKKFIKDNINALYLHGSDSSIANTIIDTYTIDFNNLKGEIPDSLKFGTINDVNLTDFAVKKLVRNWHILPNCELINNLSIYFENEKGLGDMSKSRTKKIGVLNIVVNNNTPLNNFFKNTTAPKYTNNTDHYAMCVIKNGRDTKCINELDVENIKGFHTRYLVIDERLVNWTNWDSVGTYYSRVSLKKEQEVYDKIDTIMKNNKVDYLTIAIPSESGRNFKVGGAGFDKYIIEKAKKGYKLVKA